MQATQQALDSKGAIWESGANAAPAGLQVTIPCNSVEITMEI